MSLSRRARKQLIAFAVLLAFVAIVGFGGNQLRLMRKASSAAEGLRLGTAAFEAGDYQETLDQLNRYLPTNQDDADAIYMLAKARLEVPQDGGGHYPRALALAQQAVNKDPDSIEKHLLVVEVRARSGSSSLSDLLLDIERVLGLDPSRTDLRLLMADVLRANDRTEEALEELRSIVGRDPSSMEALSRITQLLIDRPAEYSSWVASLDRQAQDNPAVASFDIARINARLRLITTTSRDTGSAAISASRALTAYDILTESLLEKTVDDAAVFRAALASVDEVERAVRLTRPSNQDEAEATQDRLETIDARARAFLDRHLGLNAEADADAPIADPAAGAPIVFAALEWLWTSDRVDRLREVAAAWRESAPGPPAGSAAIAIEAVINMTGVLPEGLRLALPESAPTSAGRLWSRLAEASDLLRSSELPRAADALDRAAEEATAVDSALLFSTAPVADRAVESFLASAAYPTLSILRAETASASGDTARAISHWVDAARQRRAWDLPALQLLDAYRSRGSIAEAEQMSSEAMLRGATLGTGLSMIESRVEQYALGLMPYESAAAAISELRSAGFPSAPLAVAEFRLAVVGSLLEPDRRERLQNRAADAITAATAGSPDDPAAAEVLVRMLRAADELGVITDPAYIPARQREPILAIIDDRFTSLSPDSKYAASLAEVAMTGVYGPAMARLSAETERVLQDDSATEQSRFEHQRILARFTSELARTYQALEDDAYQRTLRFAEDNPESAAAQLLFIDSQLRAGEIPPARTEPLTDALERLRAVLGSDSYTYNLAESRRLYATARSRTPEVARQEIITRLDRFVEGEQAGSAPVEVLQLVARWWELLPGSLDRRLRYLRRAQQTSPTAWGVYPDLVRALTEAGEWDDAAGAVAQWGRQLTPPIGLRAQRRDLARFVGERWNSIASGADAAQIRSTLWAIALNDADAVADATADPVDRLSAAQILAAAPDFGPARQRAAAVLGLDSAAQLRIDESRPRSLPSGLAAADATLAAAVAEAERLLEELPGGAGLTAETVPAVAGAGRLIAAHSRAARLTASVASGDRTDFPATVEAAPDPDAARRAIARAIIDAPEGLADRAVGMFYAFSYQPGAWDQYADEARSAMLAAAAIDGLTEAERRALVYPLSRLGAIDTAIELQRSVAEATQSEADRITDVVAIAEILREAGQTQAAYDAVLALPEDQRDRLTSQSVPASTQALVSLLELETGQARTPVTTAFARRVTDRPRETMPALDLAVRSADGSAPRMTLLELVSEDLADQSASRPEGGEFRPAIASLWFTAATSAGEDDPLRRELYTGAIFWLSAVSELDDREARAFAYRRKAYCEIELGSLDAGIRTYRQALEIDPDEAATLNNLADALLRREQFPEAAETAERAVRAADGSQIPASVRSMFYDTLGKSRRAIGATDGALIALRTAVEFDSSNAPARISLAEAQLEAGEPAEAVRATLEPIGPAAEGDLTRANRERLDDLRDRL